MNEDFVDKTRLFQSFDSAARMLRLAGSVDDYVAVDYLGGAVETILSNRSRSLEVATSRHNFLAAQQLMKEGTPRSLREAWKMQFYLEWEKHFFFAWAGCPEKDRERLRQRGESVEAFESRAYETIAKLFNGAAEALTIYAYGEMGPLSEIVDETGAPMDVRRTFRYDRHGEMLKMDSAHKKGKLRVSYSKRKIPGVRRPKRKLVREGVGFYVREALLSEGEESELWARQAADIYEHSLSKAEWLGRHWRIIATKPQVFAECMWTAASSFYGDSADSFAGNLSVLDDCAPN